MSEETVDRVVAIADPILSYEGMELVDVEFRRESSGWVLRLMIDKEGGVTLNDCTHISQEVGRHLDVEDVISIPYTLEVSSPGLTRPLKKEKDFIKYRHSFIKVKTLLPIDNRRNFKGRLLGISGGDIEIETEGRVFRIPLTHIAKANLELDTFDGAKPRFLNQGRKHRSVSTLSPSTELGALSLSKGRPRTLDRGDERVDF